MLDVSIYFLCKQIGVFFTLTEIINRYLLDLHGFTMKTEDATLSELNIWMGVSNCARFSKHLMTFVKIWNVLSSKRLSLFWEVHFILRLRKRIIWLHMKKCYFYHCQLFMFIKTTPLWKHVLIVNIMFECTQVNKCVTTVFKTIALAWTRSR